jgi:hypothetical protein
MTFCTLDSPYQTASWLTSTTDDTVGPRQWMATIGEAANERLVARKLGANGFKRWRYFRQHFSGRWGDEGQMPVSPRSQESLIKALGALEFAPGTTPSLFLTDDGHFELAWRDANGDSIQMEFGPSAFDVFVEGSGIEESHPNSARAEVIAKHLSTK